MASTLAQVYKNVTRCNSCGSLKSNLNGCVNCESLKEKYTKICVVEDIADQWSIENSIFFKQKTAYEIPLRLVGSEMCIRDSLLADFGPKPGSFEINLINSSISVSYTHLTLPTKRIV